MNKKGFILIDSLINVFIVSSLCLLCFSIYRVIDSHEDAYERYLEEINEKYLYLFNGLEVCQRCLLNEEDSSTPEH